MRRGMNSLALQVQRCRKRGGGIHMLAISMCSEVHAVTRRKSSGSAASACRSLPSDWMRDTLHGRQRPMTWRAPRLTPRVPSGPTSPRSPGVQALRRQGIGAGPGTP
jgi:hypothetical protein